MVEDDVRCMIRPRCLFDGPKVIIMSSFILLYLWLQNICIIVM